MQPIFAIAFLVLLALAFMPYSVAQQLPSKSEDGETRCWTLSDQGKREEALACAIALKDQESRAFGSSHPAYARALHLLGVMHSANGNTRLAEDAFDQAVAVYEKASVSGSAQHIQALHSLTAATLRKQSELYSAQERLSEAEALQKRALALKEGAFGKSDPELAAHYANLADIFQKLGKYDASEALYKQALAIDEATNGPSHQEVSITLNNLGVLLTAQKRYGDSLAILRRALSIKERHFPPDDQEIARTLHNLGNAYAGLNRLSEAAAMLERALEIYSANVGSDGEVRTRDSLGGVYAGLGRTTAAEALHTNALMELERRLGKQHPSVAITLQHIAALLGGVGRTAEAIRALLRALKIREAAYGPNHPSVAETANGLAGAYIKIGDSKSAMVYARRAASIAAHRLSGQQRPSTNERPYYSERLMQASVYALLKEMLKPDVKARDNALIHQGFEASQEANVSIAAASISQMATRVAAGSDETAILVREMQDLAINLREVDEKLLVETAKIDSRGETIEKLRSSARGLEERLKGLQKQLQIQFPKYSDFAYPGPVSIAEVQRLLHDDEAMIVHVATKMGITSFAVSRDDFGWGFLMPNKDGVDQVRELEQELSFFRRGLDHRECQRTLGEDARHRTESISIDPACAEISSLPFDFSYANKLYGTLFGRFEKIIALKRHLIVVPSGPLVSVPFEVLITDPPDSSVKGYQRFVKASWLVRRHAISVLPSVSAFRALRLNTKASKGLNPFVGFGNPLLAGPNGTDKSAWHEKTCPGSKGAAAVRSMRRASRSPLGEIAGYFREGLADVEEVRRSEPLPETVDELCSVAESVGADDQAVHLGEKATEGRIKALSASGALANARVVHFATHGLIAGETHSLFKARAEPALVLSPPNMPTWNDDGLLTASEVAGLKLDADWVVLSACNTAAGHAQGAEALSGLTRAFFYAGARALLVSHWYVDSLATVSLITKTFGHLKRDPKLGRAEALRRAMLSMIDAGGAGAHPAMWGAFVLVGEGRS